MKSQIVAKFLIALLSATCVARAAAQVAPLTRLVSVSGSIAGTANGESISAQISDDGRYVAFQSRASDLAGIDGNGVEDVFLRDMQTSITSLVSISLSGTSGNAASVGPYISATGQFVSFNSAASNLVVGDTFQSGDVMVRDLVAGTTSIASVGLGGAKPAQDCFDSSISADGRYVCFRSRAANLVVGDTNGNFDIFVRDMLLGTTVRANVTSTGVESPWSVDHGQISDDGRYVVFESWDPALVPGDTNGQQDVFLKDLTTGAIEIVSLGDHGQQGNGYSYYPALSADARYVLFGSFASNLVPLDNNTGGYPGDVFRRDRQLATTRMVNVSAGGEQSSSFDNEVDMAISPDGRWIAFSTNDPLIPNGGSNLEQIYLKDLTTEAVYCPSQGASGAVSNGRSFRPALAANAAAIVFDSAATNFAVPDNNGGVFDIFWHTLGAPIPTTYCTAKTNSLGCTPRIGWSGWPGISNPSHFYIVGGNMLNNTPGVMMYGVTGRAAVPFSGGLQCVQQQVKRAIATLSSGNSLPGTRCDAAYWLDFQAFATGGLGGHPLPALQTPGTTVDAQWWGRDNGFPVDRVQLSDALEFNVMP